MRRKQDSYPLSNLDALLVKEEVLVASGFTDKACSAQHCVGQFGIFHAHHVAPPPLPRKNDAMDVRVSVCNKSPS